MYLTVFDSFLVGLSRLSKVQWDYVIVFKIFFYILFISSSERSKHLGLCSNSRKSWSSGLEFEFEKKKKKKVANRRRSGINSSEKSNNSMRLRLLYEKQGS